MTEHTITKPQLLQFMHNDGSGFVAGYGKEETDAFIAEMECRHNAEISQLKAKFQRILDKLSKPIVDASKTIVTAVQDGLLDFYETMNTVDSKSEGDGNADANKVSDTVIDNDTRRKDLDELKRSIAQAVEKFNKKHPQALTADEKLELKAIYAFWIDWNHS